MYKLDIVVYLYVVPVFEFLFTPIGFHYYVLPLPHQFIYYYILIVYIIEFNFSFLL